MAIRLVVTQQAPSAADATTHPSAPLSSGVRRQRILIDCGFCQGGCELSEENARPFGFEPRSIDFVLLTHAHRLSADAAHVHEEEAERAARHAV